MHALQRAKDLFTGTIFGDQFDICSALCDVANDEWTQEQLDEIRQVADMFDELSQTAPRNAAMLRQAGETIERILNKGQEKHGVAANGDKRRPVSQGRIPNRPLPNSVNINRKAKKPC